MKAIYEIFLDSSKELKKVKNLVLASLLIAVHLLLDLFTIQILPTLHLSFEFLASSTIGMLFGPSIGALCGALGDIINYILNPKGAFFPGFTISAVVVGIIYGLVFYKKKVTILRCIAAVVLTKLIVDIGLNTVWLAVLYNKAFMVLIGARIVKNLIMIPINVFLMYVVLGAVEKIRLRDIEM